VVCSAAQVPDRPSMGITESPSRTNRRQVLGFELRARRLRKWLPCCALAALRISGASPRPCVPPGVSRTRRDTRRTWSRRLGVIEHGVSTDTKLGVDDAVVGLSVATLGLRPNQLQTPRWGTECSGFAAPKPRGHCDADRAVGRCLLCRCNPHKYTDHYNENQD
jgi:hypothetical protein